MMRKYTEDFMRYMMEKYKLNEFYLNLLNDEAYEAYLHQYIVERVKQMKGEIK